MRLTTKKLSLAVFLTSAIAFVAISASHASDRDGKRREAGAHQHGHSRISIAIENSMLQLEFEAPANDIVGFEYAAKSAEEKQAVAKATEKLKEATAIFDLPNAAQCRAAKVTSEFEVQHGGHAEFHATYEFNCQNMKQLKRIDFKVFKLFPGMQEIEVGIIGTRGQKAFEVTPAKPSILLDGMIR